MSGADHEQIKNRAYAIWEQEGRPEGRDIDHWDQATKDLSPSSLESTSAREIGPEDAGEDDDGTIPAVPKRNKKA